MTAAGFAGLVAFAASLAAHASSAVGAEATAPDVRTAARAAADYLSEGLIDVTGVPGMALAVEVDGRSVWVGTAGFSDVDGGEPVRPETRFRLASVSKLLAASTAARLSADGRLDLDAPIGQYIQGLPEHWSAITTRDLAAHLSGIPHYESQDAGRGRVRFESVSDALSVFEDRPLLFAPGTDYQYSTYGYTLLSAVLEAASGQPYLALLKNELFLPLGTGSIGPEDFRRADTYMSRSYSRGVPPVEIEPRDYSYSWAGAGMRGSARDLVRFGGAHLDGVLMSRNEFQALLRPTRTDDGRAVGHYNFEVGLGWRASTDYHGRRIAHHSGVTPGARSSLVVFPDHDAAAVTLSNASWVSQVERSTALFAALFIAESPIADEAFCPTVDADFEGTFDDDAAAASLVLGWRDGACIGTFQPQGALRDWQARFAIGSVDSLRATAFEFHGRGVTLAIAGSTGVFEVRLEPDRTGCRMTTVLGSDRAMEMTFVDGTDFCRSGRRRLRTEATNIVPGPEHAEGASPHRPVGP